MNRETMISRAATLTVLLHLIAGCSAPPGSKPGQAWRGEHTVGLETYVSVACIAAESPSEVMDALEKVLAAEGIQAGMEGSLIYDVFVRKGDAARAVEIIRKHPELRNAGIYLDGEWKKYVQERSRQGSPEGR